MKKTFIVTFAFIFFLCGALNVKASRSVCTYVVGDSTITVNYDYTKSPTYSISGGLKSSKTKAEKVNDLKNEQFFKSGKLICPNLNWVSRWSHEKHKYTYTLSPIGDAEYGVSEGTLTILENDGAENGGIIIEEQVDCIYKKGTTKSYTLKWENGKVVANLNGKAYNNYCKDDTAIKQEGFSAEDFKNGKCPDVYETEVNKHQNLSGTCKGKLVISKNPIMTENDVVTENENNDYDKVDVNISNNDKVFDFCAEDGVLKTFKIVGYLIDIIKIIVPLLLIIFGAIDYGKAVVASDEKAISKATQMLVVRSVAGIIIFFIPTIIYFITSLISNWSDIKSDFINCQTCLDNATECDSIRTTACDNSCKAKEGYSGGSLDSSDTCICN